MRSDQHLGVNSHGDDHVSFRKVTTCSPLAIEKYTDTINGTFLGYAFGPRTDAEVHYTWAVANDSNWIYSGNYDMT
jgi:hypothetical protein